MTDFSKMKASLETDAARNWQKMPSFQLEGMIKFLRQQIVDEEWQIARSKHTISVFQQAIDEMERSKTPRPATEGERNV